MYWHSTSVPQSCTDWGGGSVIWKNEPLLETDSMRKASTVAPVQGGEKVWNIYCGDQQEGSVWAWERSQHFTFHPQKRSKPNKPIYICSSIWNLIRHRHYHFGDLLFMRESTWHRSEKKKQMCDHHIKKTIKEEASPPAMKPTFHSCSIEKLTRRVT